MPVGLIDDVKALQQTFVPILLATITFTDGTIRRYCSKPLNTAEGGFTYGGNSYIGRVLDMDLGALQGFDQGGIDIVPRVSLTLADPDKILWADEQSKGFKDAVLDLDFVLWEADTANFSTDSIRKFSGYCDPATADAETISVSATNKLNLQRRMLPTLRLQRRCPWVFPTTAAQRLAAANNADSVFYYCGYSVDATGAEERGNLNAGLPFTTCDYTRVACEARGMFKQDSAARVTGNFGGIEWDPPAGNRSRDYTTGEWLDIRNAPNEARYGQPIPLVYGTTWVDPIAINVRGDGNSTRGESVVCFGEVDSIIRVTVNDVEVQPATDITGGTNYIVQDALLRYNIINRGDRRGAPNLDAQYDGLGDPYGSMATIMWVVPRRVADAGTIPRVRVLVRGPKIRVYSDATTFAVQYSENPIWVILDLLIRAGFAYSDIDLASFVTAAAVCDASISYTDQYGASASHPRFACSLVVKQQRSAAEIIRSVRRGCGAILLQNSSTGKLQVFMNGTLASQQPSAPAGTNYAVAIASKNLSGGAANGYVAYDFTKFLTREGRGGVEVSTFRVVSEQSGLPTRISSEFINSERDWSADSLSVIDTAALVRNHFQEVAQSLDAEGINTMDQAKRITARAAAEALRGNDRNDAGGTELYEFEHSFTTIRVRAGHICRLSNSHYGISNKLVRVLQIRPSADYRTAWLLVARHNDDWYVDTYGQEPDAKESRHERDRLARPAFPWCPRGAQPHNDDPMYDETDWSFTLEPMYEDTKPGPRIAQLEITGRWPVNIFSPLSAPIVGRQGTTAATGGTVPGGNSLYYIAVCAVDADGLLTTPSRFCEVVVTAGGNTNTITVPVLQWPTGATGYKVFAGRSPNRLSFQAEAGTTPASITLTAFNQNNYGLPDQEFDRLRARVKRIVHSGVFGIAVTGVGAGTLTVAGAGWTTNEWANYDCSILGIAAGGALAIRNFLVSSNTATVLTVTPDPQALGIAVGDVLVMRSKPTVGSDGGGNYLEDARWLNTLSNNGNGLDTTGSEVGNILRFIAGPGRGDFYRVKNVTDGGAGNGKGKRIYIDGDWLRTPTAASRYVIEEADWKVTQTSESLNNADPAAVVKQVIEVSQYLASVIAVQVFAVDGGDNPAFESLSPYREIYIFGKEAGQVESNAFITVLDYAHASSSYTAAAANAHGDTKGLIRFNAASDRWEQSTRTSGGARVWEGIGAGSGGAGYGGWFDVPYSANITINLDNGVYQRVGQMTSSPIFEAPTNAVNRELYLMVRQDGVGGRVPSWNAAWDKPDWAEVAGYIFGWTIFHMFFDESGNAQWTPFTHG